MLIYSAAVTMPRRIIGAIIEAQADPSKIVRIEMSGQEVIEILLAMNLQRHLDAIASLSDPSYGEADILKGIGILPWVGMTVRAPDNEPMGAVQFLDIYGRGAPAFEPLRTVDAVEMDVYMDAEPLLSGFGLLISALHAPAIARSKRVDDRAQTALRWALNQRIEPDEKRIWYRGLYLDTVNAISSIVRIPTDKGEAIYRCPKEFKKLPRQANIQRGNRNDKEARARWERYLSRDRA